MRPLIALLSAAAAALGLAACGSASSSSAPPPATSSIAALLPNVPGYQDARKACSMFDAAVEVILDQGPTASTTWPDGIGGDPSEAIGRASNYAEDAELALLSAGDGRDFTWQTFSRDFNRLSVAVDNDEPTITAAEAQTVRGECQVITGNTPS